MAKRRAEGALHNHPSDAAYLRDLANRLMKVPVCFGVDGFDIDCLSDMARRIERETSRG